MRKTWPRNFLDIGLCSVLCSRALLAACFDFHSKIAQPLKAAPPYSRPEASEVTESGYLADKVAWAAVRGRVNRPISALIAKIEDPHTTAGARVSKLAVETVADPNYLLRRRVTSTVKVLGIFPIEWTVDWGFALTGGTTQSPEQLVASYEKIEGTSHIPLLCGNIVLSRVSPQATDVYLYEQVKATGRSSDDTLHGLSGTLEDMRHNQ